MVYNKTLMILLTRIQDTLKIYFTKNHTKSQNRTINLDEDENLIMEDESRKLESYDGFGNRVFLS